LASFFERGFEAGDKTVWQIADKPDGVGKEDGSPTGKHPAAGAGVERGKELICGIDARAGEGIHQRTLAGIRVADERHGQAIIARGNEALLAFFDATQLVAELVNSAFDEAAIFFDLLFAGPSHTDSGFDTRQVGPHP